MTTATTTLAAPTDTHDAINTVAAFEPHTGPSSDRSPIKVTFGRLAQAELLKFRSVRSNLVALFGAAGAAIGLGMLFTQVAGSGDGPQFSDGLSLSLAGFDLATMIIAILGVSTVAIEYQTGLIRGWIAAAPDRLRLLWAKVSVYSGLTFVVTGIAAMIAFVVGQALLPDTMTALSLGDDGVLQALAGTAFYAAAIAAIGVALGFLFRSTAAGASIVVALLLIVPIMTNLLPDWVAEPLAQVLPSNAGAAVTGLGSERGAELLSTTGGIVTLCAWVAAAVGAAAVALKTRDA